MICGKRQMKSAHNETLLSHYYNFNFVPPIKFNILQLLLASVLQRMATKDANKSGSNNRIS